MTVTTFDEMTNSSSMQELVTKFVDRTTDDERIEGYQILLDKQKHEIGPSDELVLENIGKLLELSYSDALSKNLELASRALKCLGYFIHHPVYVQSISDEEAATVLLTLVKAVTLANDKVYCNLSIWCISVQQFKASVVDLHIESLVGAIVHAIDNPMGSLAVTFEAMQALATIRKITPTKTREHSHVWAPPIYRRLVSNDKRERDVADSALREMLSSIKPPTPTLSQVTAIDINKSLLMKMKTMVATSGQAVVAINAWRWFIVLLGDQLVGSASMVNEMLKIPEATFISNDAQARLASQVSWESLIDALVPVFTEGPPEMSQVRPKRLKLLLMPILSAIKFEQDTAVKNQYWGTWMHLLRRLDRHIHEPHVFENAVIPGLEVAFQSGPLKDPWIWKNCLALVESYVSSRSSVPPDFRKLAFLGLDNHDQSLPSLQQVATNIKWEPWKFTGLESLLTVVRTLWDSGMKDFQEKHHSTSGISSMYAAVKIWYIIVEAVKTDQMSIVTPSNEQVGAVHSLLKFVFKISNPERPRGMECLTWTWRFINVLVDELGPIILASRFYKIASPWQDGAEFSAEQTTNFVSPVIYLIAVWLNLVSVESLDQSGEADILQSIETLIRASKAGDNMGNLQGIMTSLDWLSKLISKGNRDILVEKKGVWVFLLKVWRAVTEQLKTHIEGINDIPSGDTGYQAVLTVLLFPVKFYLQGEVQENVTDISVAELKSFRICWIQLHDTLCRISSLKNSHSNSFSAGFFQRVLKVIDGQQVSRVNGQRRANLPEFVELVASGVISALNQVGVSSVAVLALNSKRRRFSCTSGMHDANNVKDVLSVAARLLILAATEFHASSAEVTIRIMEALSSYAKHIYSQHDTLLLLHVLAKPLACWLKLGLRKDLSMALVEKLLKLWDGLLHCLKECQPALVFNSNLLAIQASCLGYALQHPYHPISNVTLSFWEATYGSKAPPLKFPSALVPVLMKLKRKVEITLPGFEAAVHDEKRTKQISSLEADSHMEERQPTTFDSFDQKMTTESPHAVMTGTKSASLNPAAKDGSGENLRSTAAVGENARVSDPGQELVSSTTRQTITNYVVVASSQLKKSRPLTDHQKEVRKLQRREGPGVKTYTCADFSQGDLPGYSEDPEADLEDFCLDKLDILPGAACYEKCSNVAAASTSAEADKNSKIASAARQASGGIARDRDFVNEALAYAADFTAPDSMQLIMDDDSLLPNGHSDKKKFAGSEQEAGTNRDNAEAPRKLKRGRQPQRTYPMKNSSSTAEMNILPSCEQTNAVEQGMSKLIGSKTTMGMLATLATWSRWDELDAEELMQAKMLLELIQEKVGPSL